MHRQRLNLLLGVLATLITGCRPSGPPVPTVTPALPAEAADTGTTADTRDLRFSPGSFRYHFLQSTSVRARSSADTIPSIITTRAVLLVDIISHSDSVYDVVVSVDSLQMRAEGSVSSRSVADRSFLGPVLQASFRSNNRTIETHLPDSLCAYGQFVTAARELLLPQLPIHIRTPLTRVWVDTTNTVSCRAGTRIDMLVTQEIRDLGREPHELAFQGRTEVKGAGVLHRDSVVVSGFISTRGSASFTQESRLPSLVQSESEGSITVRLGNLTMVFQQNSTQHIQHQEAATPN